jgi:hypothetical protein
MRLLSTAGWLAPAVICLAFVGAASAAAPPISAECAAALEKASVDEAYKVVAPKPQAPAQPGAAGASDPEPRVTNIALGDVIELKVSGLGELLKACPGQTIVLFLNGYSMTGLKPGPLVIPSAGLLRFTLKFADEVRATWVPILGYPSFKPRDLVASIGVEGQYPVKALGDRATLKLETVGNRWFAIWGLLFVGMVVIFYWCVVHTNIIRDGSAAADAAGVRRAYSLSKSQGAVWFFVILAAYLLIGLVTGDFVNSINSTALILLGIGAGTVIGSALIDASKEADNVAAKAKAIGDAKAKLDGINQRLAQIETELRTNVALTADQRAALQKEQADKLTEKVAAESDCRKATGANEQFLTDILSDANGVSFHRFQMAVWTVVLAFVFIKGVYENLAMPVFDTTLMGLLGLSAGTYLGLKIPEATTPKRT